MRGMQHCMCHSGRCVDIFHSLPPLFSLAPIECYVRKEGEMRVCVYIQCDTYIITIIINVYVSCITLTSCVSSLPHLFAHGLSISWAHCNYGYIRETCEPNHLVFVGGDVNKSINPGVAWLERGERVLSIQHLKSIHRRLTTRPCNTPSFPPLPTSLF